MFLDEVLHKNSKIMHPIVAECSIFIEMSGEMPLLKNLPCHHEDFRKVKLRMRKKKANDEFARTFNEAFDQIPHLRQRAMFANGTASFVAEAAEREPFYIFPIDGFQFMYSLEVTNSNTDYMKAFDTILEQFNGDNKLMEQVLKYTYTQEHLQEGIKHGSEIILYNMPYCYAIRSQSVDTYQDLIFHLKEG